MDSFAVVGGIVHEPTQIHDGRIDLTAAEVHRIAHV